MKVLQLTCHYSPNIGGVETHLLDLVSHIKKTDEVFVLTYQPLTSKVPWKVLERGKKQTILRIPWISNLFYKLVKHPMLEFLYLFPGLFVVLPFVLLIYNPRVIHSHGLVAGTVGAFWGKIFRKKIVLSFHSIYHFPKTGLYRNFVKLISKNSDKILCLSNQSEKEIEQLGVNASKIDVFTYWIDLEKFKEIKDVKKDLKINNKFIVLYVGRLVEEKGIKVLLDSAKSWDKGISLFIAGTGPLETTIRNYSKKYSSIKFIGPISQNKLPEYYSVADLLIVPSIHEEGFGRVILESLACGTPVIATNRGATSEAMDESVGKLIDISEENIKNTVEHFYNHPDDLEKCRKVARKYAEEKFSEKNAKTITSSYKD